MSKETRGSALDYLKKFEGEASQKLRDRLAGNFERRVIANAINQDAKAAAIEVIRSGKFLEIPDNYRVDKNYWASRLLATYYSLTHIDQDLKPILEYLTGEPYTSKEPPSKKIKPIIDYLLPKDKPLDVRGIATGYTREVIQLLRATFPNEEDLKNPDNQEIIRQVVTAAFPGITWVSFHKVLQTYLPLPDYVHRNQKFDLYMEGLASGDRQQALWALAHMLPVNLIDYSRQPDAKVMSIGQLAKNLHLHNSTIPQLETQLVAKGIPLRKFSWGNESGEKKYVYLLAEDVTDFSFDPNYSPASTPPIQTETSPAENPGADLPAISELTTDLEPQLNESALVAAETDPILESLADEFENFRFPTTLEGLEALCQDMAKLERLSTYIGQYLVFPREYSYLKGDIEKVFASGIFYEARKTFLSSTHVQAFSTLLAPDLNKHDRKATLEALWPQELSAVFPFLTYPDSNSLETINHFSQVKEIWPYQAEQRLARILFLLLEAYAKQEKVTLNPMARKDLLQAVREIAREPLFSIIKDLQILAPPDVLRNPSAQKLIIEFLEKNYSRIAWNKTNWEKLQRYLPLSEYQPRIFSDEPNDE